MISPIVAILLVAVLLMTALFVHAAKDARKWHHSHDQFLISFGNREKELTTDADRLAAIVRQYVKDIETTAALLKDEAPPVLFSEREALMLHDKLANKT